MDDIKNVAKKMQRKKRPVVYVDRIKANFKKKDGKRVREAAEKAGFKCTATFIREVVLTYLNKKYIRIIHQPAINLVTSSLLRYSSNNLNQLVNILHILKLEKQLQADSLLIERIEGLVSSFELIRDNLKDEIKGFENDS